MPPDPPIDPPSTALRALEAVRAQFAPILQDLGPELDAELGHLAREMTHYWQLREAGKTREAEDNLRFMRTTASLIADRYALRTASAGKAALIAAVEGIAQIGAILLRGLIAAA